MSCVKVLLAARLPLVRANVSQLLASYSGIEIVAICDSAAGLAQANKRSVYDILVLHLDMEGGTECWLEIMANSPKPTIGICSASKPTQRNLFLKAGGLVVFEESLPSDFPETVKLYSEIKVVSRRSSSHGSSKPTVPETVMPPPPIARQKLQTPQLGLSHHRFQAVLIGASTGGPKIILSLLDGWAGRLPVPVLIVQHITAGGFLENLTTWLHRDSKTTVEIAKHGDELKAGVAYFAPDGYHLHPKTSHNKVCCEFSSQAPRYGFRPSIDVFFESAAEELGPKAIGILLTGMGRDGALGLKKMFSAGATTFAQDEASCAVYGMPQEAMTLGAVSHQMTPSQICETTLRLFGLHNGSFGT